MIGRCPNCLAKFSIDDSKIGSKGIKLPCSKCGAMFSVLPPGSEAAPPAAAETVEAMVLIAHDSHAFCKEARRLLEESPHKIKVLIAHDDEELLSSLRSEPLNLVLVDICLPGMFGFEVAAKIRNDMALRHIKVLLISSVYVPMGHKRPPSSVHGADDFIEAYQLREKLVDKVVRLLTSGAPTVAVSKPAPKTMANAPVAAAPPKPAAKPAEPSANSPDHLRAQRLARIIVKDIALYNQEVIEKGLKGGNVMKLLEKELKEGRDFYVKRVPEEIRFKTNYLEEELQALFQAPAAVRPKPEPIPETKPATPVPDSLEHQKAQRLARTIVSDITLYNQEAIEKGLKGGNVMKLLEKDLKEARDLYVKRVAEEIRFTTNYLGDELQAMFDRKRKELGL